VLALALALALALSLPAAVRGEEEPPPAPTGFELAASNGYELIVIAVAPEREGSEGSIGLYLVRGKREGVTYAAPAIVTPTSIEADLGRVGRISVTRASIGGTRTERDGCKSGGRKTIPAERYEGTIEFHGEEGFTDVSATGAPLRQWSNCEFGDAPGRPAGKSLPGARLSAEKERPDRYGFHFDAVQPRPGARTQLSTEIEEHRGEIEIHRATFRRASAAALRFDRGLRNATVRPPAPFAGFGRFDAGASRANQWTGNLTVDLPGHAGVPLVGPGFSAGLEHPRR
jgi:hypothetical protein